uniref:Minor histocompatibility antigen H13 n=1 Tax=Heterorhabditis bacteriophora TaxID=37862 RepID=A0A1I7XHD6_HETBA
MVDTPAVQPLIDSINATANTTFTFEEQATASCSLYAMSLLCIVVGGIRSADFVRKQMSKKRLLEVSITLAEAKKFPFTASMVLFGLYIFFKPDGREWLISLGATYLPEKYSMFVNKTLAQSEGPGFLTRLGERLPTDMAILNIKHSNAFLGCVALATILKPLFSFVLRLLPIGDRRPRVNIPYLLSVKKGKNEMDEGDIVDAKKDNIEYLLKVEVDTHDVVAIAFCLSVAISHIYKRHWITNNIIGIAFSIYGIENLHLSSFKAGSLLLVGLFIYDVFWVFATDVMTSVAKGIDAPILLQFPQDIFRNGWKDATKYSMLGLGDIVIPGIYIALLRRFDQRIGENKEGKKGQLNKGRRFYFQVTVIAYALGLLITMVVMHHFKAAQPALLYLVKLWNYNEEHLIEKKDEKISSTKKNN